MPEAQSAHRSSRRQALLDKLLRESGFEPALADAIQPRKQSASPLSHGQQRLWLVQQLDPQSAAYHVPLHLRLRGRLDREALSMALNQIVQRHEILRSRIYSAERPSDDGGSAASEQLAAQEPQSLSVDLLGLPVDLEHLDPQTRLAEATRLAVEEENRPFDLSRGPLIRARLIRMSDEDHVLALVMHHIASDAVSNGILIRELTALYQGFACNEPAQLAPLSVQYGDFAQWQRERGGSAAMNEAMEYWRQQVKGVGDVQLPIDHARPAEQTYAGSACALRLPLPFAQRLRELAASQNGTLYMVLLAAFQVLLHKYGSPREFLIGWAVAGRERAELQNLIGLFVNTLVMRSDLTGNPTFAELFSQRVCKTVADAVRYQDLPFEALVKELVVDRDLSRNPLFQVAFSLQPELGLPLKSDQVEFTWFDTGARSTRFDLEGHVIEDTQGLDVRFVFNRDLFEPETVQRLLDSYRVLLEQVAHDPNTKLADLCVLAPCDLETVTKGFNAHTHRDFPQACVHELFERQAAAGRDRIALEFGDESMSYGALNAEANRLAHHLKRRSIGANSTVAICMERSPRMIVAILAVLKAGAAYVPLDPDYPISRQKLMLEAVRAAAVLSERKFAETLPSTSAGIILLDVIAEELNREPQTNPQTAVTSDSRAYIMFTSGSTGVPKGVEIPHRGIVRLVCDTDYIAFAASESFLQMASPSFDASTFEIWGALLNGARLALYAERVPNLITLGKALRDHRVSTIFVTTALFNAIVDEAPEILQDVRQLLFGGERCSLAHVRKALRSLSQTRIFHVYGPTETTTFAACFPVTRGLPDNVNSLSLGKPITNTQIYILDDAHRPVPIGVPGEVCIGGPGLALGYLGDQQLTDGRFITNPLNTNERLYRSGDLARWTAQGNIDFLGRIDQQVKIRGFRVEPGEIEAALLAQPHVQRAFVLCREDSPGHKRLVAYVVVNATVSADELLGSLKDYLPAYMVPSHVLFMPDFPLGPTGKVLKDALPSPETISSVASEPSTQEPLNDREQRLAELWTSLLGVDRVARDDNFFSLGGDSIIAVQLVSRAAKAGLKLTTRQLFQNQTIAELATVVEVSPSDQASAEVDVAAPSKAPLTPIQLWFFEQQPAEPQHFNQSIVVQLRRRIGTDVLQRAIQRLVEHHDALRTRFPRNKNSQQQVAAANSLLPSLQHHDLTAHDAAGASEAFQRIAVQAQQSMNLENGDLVQAVLVDFPAGQPQRLLIAIHHLVVDAVSWRIILEDLATLLSQNNDADHVGLPKKTLAYGRWAQRLADAADSMSLPPVLQRLLGDRNTIAAPLLPYSGDASVNVSGSAGSVVVTLERAQTQLLIQQAPAAYRTRVDELILTAVAKALSEWIGDTHLLLDVEGHGRDALGGNIDVSRTVGWFTCIYPMMLRWVDSRPDKLIKQIKEQAREARSAATAFGSLRYLHPDQLLREQLAKLPHAQIGFNYLGQFDASFGNDSPFALAAESTGPVIAAANRRRHLIDIDARIIGGKLEIEWTYSSAIHDDATIRKIADRGIAELSRLIEHCCSGNAGGATPSDFPLVQVTQNALDDLWSHVGLIDDLLPASGLQEGMLFQHAKDPASGLYLVQFSTDLDGQVDETAFREAWRTVAARHGALRSVFSRSGAAEPIQVVLRNTSLDFIISDWRDIPSADQEKRFDQLLEDQRKQPVDLERKPPTHWHLIRLADARWRMLWSVHHILLDGWSVAVVLNEVMEAYSAIRHGQALKLPPVVPTARYIEWSRSQDQTVARSYWTNALAGFESPTSLNSTHASQSAAKSAERVWNLSVELTAKVQRFASQHAITLNALIEGAFAILLSRYSGETTVTFGETVSGRPAELQGVERMVGLFINTLPARITMGDPHASVVDWLKAFQNGQSERRQFEHTPLVSIREWCGIPHDTALFETLFVFENYPVEESLRNRQSALPLSNVRFIEQLDVPLALAVVVPGDRVMMRAVYDASRFAPTTIERLLASVENTLASIVAHDRATLGEIQMIDAAQRDALVRQVNRTRRPYPKDQSVHALFATIAKEHPQRIAIRDSDGSALSYAQLDCESNRVARKLSSMGVRRGTPVGLCVRRGARLIIGMLGILKAGGVYVPLDDNQPASRSRQLLEDAGAAIVVTEKALAPTLVGSQSIQVLCLDENSETPATNIDVRPWEACNGDDLAYIMYTSGSTGQPKGVCVPHRAIARLVLSTDYCQVVPEDHVAQISNAAFDAATFEIWAALLNGAQLEIIARDSAVSAEGLSRAIAERDLSVMFVTTALFNQLSLQPGIFAPLRCVMTGGEMMDPAAVRRVIASGGPQRLLHVYGPTENTTFSTWHHITHVPEDATTVPIGRAIANSTCYVLDANLQPCPVGVPGELYVGGDGVACGYLNRPQLTAERFIPDPFEPAPNAMLYRTGDIVRWNEDHQLEFIGRRDHQIKLRGFRVELGEIEAAMLAFPGVRQSVVICRQDSAGEKQLLGYVAPKVDVDALRSFLRERLPHYMVPSTLIALDQFPLNANGKIDRAALPHEPSPVDTVATAPVPAGELEQRISSIWSEILGHSNFGSDDNFFDIGGHSLRLARVHARLKQEFQFDRPLTDLFEHSTVRALAKLIAGNGHAELSSRAVADQTKKPSVQRAAIAIIATAGRFPGAPDPISFWNNVRDGVESIHRLTREELLEAGIDPALIDSPHYVAARGYLEDVDQFDAAFFGYTPREAELIDPQQRIFLECAWEAIERAGHDPQQYAGKIGVYAGCNLNTYLNNLRDHPELIASAGDLQLLTSSDKDFLATRTAYKLDLRGPAVSVQTACSTSLVAVHQACQSLINGDCDMALAGGASITLPLKRGYLYTEQGIASPDGHCRAFDKDAAGTVGGDGVAIVVLKRLEDALRDGDHIHAVIRGSAINNDGGAKIGFTAPSIEGQAAAIASAMQTAQVDPATLDYIEAHGTGTHLGDPIEIAALRRVMPQRDDGRKCLIGSVKSNVGHLDAAAGAAGLIKTVFALEHEQIPPVLHFVEPNPKLELTDSAFAIADRLLPWKRGDRPRRAGVSSFGMGGTNAHVVVEEAPVRKPGEAARQTHQVLLLSARTEAALDAATRRLLVHLEQHPHESLADVAHTLRVGRRRFEHRRAIVCANTDDAIKQLRAKHVDGARQNCWTSKAANGGVVFLFPGQGTQHVAMGRGLYESNSHFRAEVDRSAALFSQHGIDVLEVLVPEDNATSDIAKSLEQTSVTQAALFTIEVALARLWMHWGIKPVACIGHSIGEISAAVICGSISLEDGVRVVATRGQLMDRAPAGAMLAVTLSREEITRIIDSIGGVLWIAAENSPSLCSVSGTVERIEELSRLLASQGIEAKRLHTSGAFHSGLMDGVAEQLAQQLSEVRVVPPKIPYVSNVTGTWQDWNTIEPAKYFARHVRQTVNFASGISRILTEKRPSAFLEIGPGQVLGQLARAQFDPAMRQTIGVIASMRHPSQTDADDEQIIAGAIAQLAVRGIEVDWNKFEPAAGRKRVELPTYPFQRQRYWIDPLPRSSKQDDSNLTERGKRLDVAQWLYAPVWSLETFRREVPVAGRLKGRTVLLLQNDDEMSRGILKKLNDAGATVVSVRSAEAFDTAGDQDVAVRSDSVEDWKRLLGSIRQAPTDIVHLWCAAGADTEMVMRRGFDAIRTVVKACPRDGDIRLTVVASGLCDVSGSDAITPPQSILAGLCRVLPQERRGLRCQLIDVQSTSVDETAQNVLREMLLAQDEPIVAYRGRRRAVQTFVPVDPRDLSHELPLPLRERGVYWITGGLGNVGFTMARVLAEKCRVRLVLSGRSEMPARDSWDSYLESHSSDDAGSRRIARVRELERLGAEVLPIQADSSNPAQIREALLQIDATFGALHGVIHAAADTSHELFAAFDQLSPEMSRRHMGAKVHGLIHLNEALRERTLDFRHVTSSLASLFGGAGMSAYAAANAFVDSFAEAHGWTSVQWDGWRFDEPESADAANISPTAMTAAEGAAAFEMILRLGAASCIAVCTTDFQSRWNRWVVQRGQTSSRSMNSDTDAILHDRPQLSETYVGPRDDLEQSVADMWSELIGIDRIGMNDDFFELGGHSLMATQLLSRIRDTFMVEIALQHVFAGPTVTAMSRLIVERERKPGQSQKIAGLVQKLKKMSPQEREALRARQQAASGKAGR